MSEQLYRIIASPTTDFLLDRQNSVISGTSGIDVKLKSMNEIPQVCDIGYSTEYGGSRWSDVKKSV